MSQPTENKPVTLTNPSRRRVVIGPTWSSAGQTNGGARMTSKSIRMGSIEDEELRRKGEKDAESNSVRLSGAQAQAVRGKALSGALERAGIRVL